MSAEEHLRAEQFAYRGQHQPASYGALHEADKAYPDVYEHPEYYSSGEPHEAEAHRSMMQARGNPEHMTRIYRALPHDAPDPSINPGDWVTPSKAYAKVHAESQGGNSDKPWKVASLRVPAKHVHLTGDYLPEAGYFPDSK